MSLKENIEHKLGVSTRIRLGKPGALDVFVDGEKIYSKDKTGRLPGPDEIVDLIRARIPA